MKRQIILLMFLSLFLLLIVFGPTYFAEGEIYQKGAYSLTLTPEPEMVVKEVPVDVILSDTLLLRSIMSNFHELSGQNASLYRRPDNIKKEEAWDNGSKSVYTWEKENENLEIMTTIYPSVQKAEEGTLDYLNNLGEVLKVGTTMDKPLGDNSWCKEDSEGPLKLVFIRKNVLVDVTGSTNELTMEVAREIDWVLSMREVYAKKHYFIERKPEPKVLVEPNDISLDKIAKVNLAGYEKVREREMWPLSWKSYYFWNSEEKKSVEIRIAFLGSACAAEEVILDELNQVADMYKAGWPMGELVSNTWWLRTTTPKEDIIFVRGNVLVWISASDFSLTETLAKEIEDRIVAISK